MTISGVSDEATHPPKIARQLKAQIAELLMRYTFDEVMAELSRQKPKFDIYVTPAGVLPSGQKCPRCKA